MQGLYIQGLSILEMSSNDEEIQSCTMKNYEIKSLYLHIAVLQLEAYDIFNMLLRAKISSLFVELSLSSTIIHESYNLSLFS